MKENLPFDDYIKDQFNGYSPDVPGHILENIMAKRGSKPTGFWMNILNGGKFFKLFLLLVAAGGTGYFIICSSNNISSHNSAGNNNTYPILKTTNVSADKNVTAGNTTGSNSAADNTTIGTPSHSQPEENITKEQLSQPTSGSSSLNKGTFTSISYNTKIKNSAVRNIYNTDEVNNQSSLVAESKNDLINTKVYSPFKFENAREISGLKILNSKNIKLPDCPTIEKNAAGNKKYWEVYAAPDKAFETYKSYGDTTSANYLQRRKASTKFASAFSAGIRYTKVFDNGVSVRAGLNYSQVNEKFLYFNPSELKYVTVITTRVIIRSPGDTLYINDTLQYQQSGTRTKTTYNRYRNIDIPLVFGYELGNGKIHANINAGVIINIYCWYKGDMLDSLYQPVSITTGKANSVYGFKNNIGIGFLGSVSLYYKLTDDLHLLLEPYFRYNLSPMSMANLNLQQKYSTAGLRAGIRFDLK